MLNLTTMFNLPKPKKADESKRPKEDLYTRYGLPKANKRACNNSQASPFEPNPNENEIKTEQNETESLKEENTKTTRQIHTCDQSIHKLIDMVRNVLNIQKKEFPN